jgi:hypothetical protein
MNPREREKEINEIEELLKPLRGRLGDLFRQGQWWEDYDTMWETKVSLLSDEERKLLWTPPKAREKELKRVQREQSEIAKRIIRLTRMLRDLQTEEDQFDDVTPNASKKAAAQAKALAWAVKQYIKELKPTKARDVIKDRPISREAIDKFFPWLKGKERSQKIDSFRSIIVTGVKKQLHALKRRST